jgi:hypothetical protein
LVFIVSCSFSRSACLLVSILSWLASILAYMDGRSSTISCDSTFPLLKSVNFWHQCHVLIVATTAEESNTLRPANFLHQNLACISPYPTSDTSVTLYNLCADRTENPVVLLVSSDRTENLSRSSYCCMSTNWHRDVLTSALHSNVRDADHIENSLSVEICLRSRCLATVWANTPHCPLLKAVRPEQPNIVLPFCG